jgi:peptidoglycan/LPS O-acetylase OafA/YrhL
MQKHQRYFNSIDGLRLIASVNIVLFHFEQIGGFTSMNGSPGWFFRIVKGPAFHASLFFILGGFIFTSKYAGHIDRFSASTFLKNRIRDLYPLHALTTVLMAPFVIFSSATVSVSLIGGIVFSLGVHLSMLWAFFPFFSYSLNTPSWALSAFFLCYLLFAPVCKFIAQIQRRTTVWIFIAGALLPSLLWGIVYTTGSSAFRHEYYLFFHIFAPVRFFEFVLGMLLCRLYTLNREQRHSSPLLCRPYLNDTILIVCCTALFFNLKLVSGSSVLLSWLAYHLFCLPVFAVMVYCFADGTGWIVSFFAIPVVRRIGQSSFYPYLLHIPAISWTCWILKTGFGYKTFLHSPLNIMLFIVVLYGGSTFYFHTVRKRRRKLPPVISQ